MISVIITAFREERTIGKAMLNVSAQISKEDEILVIAPDKETLDAANKIGKIISNIKVVRDPGKGKPAALNLAKSKAKGEILVLTDGDVFVLNNAIPNLIEKLKDEKVGAVTGRPVSSKNGNIYEYWGYVLADIAHRRRIKARKNGKRIFCSGYLFAIRKKLMPNLPEGLLSEDGYVSHKVYEQGYSIDYSDKSKVFVKYPSNFDDWLKQKIRSVGGYNQIKSMTNAEIRSFKKEAKGVTEVARYMKGVRKSIWMFSLIFARLYLWKKIREEVGKKNPRDIWVRIESTK